MQPSREALVELIKSKIQDRGLTPATASKAIGKNHAYLQQFLKRGVPHELPERVRQSLAGLLLINEAELRISIPNTSAEYHLLRDKATLKDHNPEVVRRTDSNQEGGNMGEDGLKDAVIKDILNRLSRVESHLFDARQDAAQEQRQDPRRRRKA
jgi:hypothetical protein